MYDSTSAQDIPADAEMVAGYINGTFQWSDADWARFPNAVMVRISVNAQTDDGQVLDVEQGDAYPHEAPGWVAMRRAAGIDPTVYCNRANVDAVKSAFLAANMPLPHLWLAAYDGLNGVPDGYVAKQYADQAMIPGQPHYDLSAVADFWPGVDGDQMTADQVVAAIEAKYDLANTITAIKDLLGRLVHANVYGTKIFVAPVDGATLFGMDRDMTVVGWTYSDGSTHWFKDGVEVTK